MSEALNPAHEEAAKQSKEPIVGLDGDKAISDELSKTAQKDDIFADFSDKVPEKTMDDSRMQEAKPKKDPLGDADEVWELHKKGDHEAADKLLREKMKAMEN